MPSSTSSNAICKGIICRIAGHLVEDRQRQVGHRFFVGVRDVMARSELSAESAHKKAQQICVPMRIAVADAAVVLDWSVELNEKRQFVYRAGTQQRSAETAVPWSRLDVCHWWEPEP